MQISQPAPLLLRRFCPSRACGGPCRDRPEVRVRLGFCGRAVEGCVAMLCFPLMALLELMRLVVMAVMQHGQSGVLAVP